MKKGIIMKKWIIGILLGCSVFMSACASSQDKAADVQPDGHAQSEGKLDNEGTEEPEKQMTQEVIFDPYIPQLNLSDIDPYEKNLFEVFGLDNDFPKPKNAFNQVWLYSTTGGEEIDPKSGDTVQLSVGCFLNMDLEPQFYEDYLDEIREYLIAAYSKQTRGIAWYELGQNCFTVLMDNGDFIVGEVWQPVTLEKYSPTDAFEIEAVVEKVEVGNWSLYDAKDDNIKLKSLGEHPSSVRAVTSDGVKLDLSIVDWAEFRGDRMTHENIEWERVPQEGDKIKIKGYTYDEKYIRKSVQDFKEYLNAGSALVSAVEFVDN